MIGALSVGELLTAELVQGHDRDTARQTSSTKTTSATVSQEVSSSHAPRHHLREVAYTMLTSEGDDVFCDTTEGR